MMNITDLNIDCIESILDYLEFEDFLNAAFSNKRINHAAKFVFARKYNKNMRYCFSIKPRSWRLPIHQNHEITYIFRLKLALLMLRCFGCVIKRIEIMFTNTVYDEYITSYMNQFCVFSMIELHMMDIPENELHLFKHLPIPNDIICRQYIINTLKLNSQLKKFVVNSKCRFFDANTLEHAKNSLQNLEILVLIIPSKIWFSNFNQKPIHLENVKYLNIEFTDREICVPREFPFSFHKLETFNIQVKFFSYFITFIEKNPTISTLGLMEYLSRGTLEYYEKLSPILKNINWTLTRSDQYLKVTIDSSL